MLKIQSWYDNLNVSEKHAFLKLCTAQTIANNATDNNLIQFENPLNEKICVTTRLRIVTAVKQMIATNTEQNTMLQDCADELDFSNPLNLPRQRFVGKFQVDGENYYLVKEKQARK